MPSVFICYRREDTAPYAGWLRQALVTALGKDRVFMDIDTIAPGADFEDVIQTTLDQVDAVLVLIGPKWATVADVSNLRRLDNPDDYIRLEVATGLKRRIRVIPILVGGASVPRRDQLPEDIQSLARRQAMELSEKRWDHDTTRLIESLQQLDAERTAPTLAPAPLPPPPVAGGNTQPSEAVDHAPALGGVPLEAASPSPTTLVIDPEVKRYFLREVEPLFKSQSPREDIGQADVGLTVPVPEPAVVSRTAAQHSEPQSYVNKEPSGASADVSSPKVAAAAPTFAHLIGADGDRVQWHLAGLFVFAMNLPGVPREAIYANFDFDLWKLFIVPDLMVTTVTGCVAVAAFRYLPAVGASIVAGLASMSCVVLIQQIRQEPIGPFVISLFLEPAMFYGFTSWSVRRFESAVLAPVVSGTAASLVSFVVASGLPGSGGLPLATSIALGVLEGLSVGVVLFFAKRWRTSHELQLKLGT